MAQAGQVRDRGRRAITVGDVDGRHTGLRLLVDRDNRKAAGRAIARPGASSSTEYTMSPSSIAFDSAQRPLPRGDETTGSAYPAP